MTKYYTCFFILETLPGLGKRQGNALESSPLFLPSVFPYHDCALFMASTGLQNAYRRRIWGSKGHRQVKRLVFQAPIVSYSTWVSPGPSSVLQFPKETHKSKLLEKKT